MCQTRTPAASGAAARAPGAAATAISFVDLTPEEIAAFKPVRQRLVCVHPVTARRSLFLSSQAGAIVG
jgi:predicted Zn-dependent protease